MVSGSIDNIKDHDFVNGTILNNKRSSGVVKKNLDGSEFKLSEKEQKSKDNQLEKYYNKLENQFQKNINALNLLQNRNPDIGSADENRSSQVKVLNEKSGDWELVDKADGNEMAFEEPEDK